MRKDFDYVEFSDYQKDMDDLGQQAASVAQHLTRQADEKDTMLWAIVRATGGKVTVRKGDLMRGKPEHWRITRNVEDDSITYEIAD